jgi:2,3-bisphosphoglycerate-dependent phosphoglycerate mutase
MRNIYLVRHGQSMANVDKAIHSSTPDHAIPLSALGEQQATLAGSALQDLLAQEGVAWNTRMRIWTSPYKRTRDTADLLQAELMPHFTNMDRRENIMLCEQQFGLFDGIPDNEIPVRFPQEHAHYALAEKFEGRFWPRMPMGESRFDVALRVHQAFGTFHRDADRHGIENIIVVCHGVVLRAFVMQWRHLPYEWFEAQKNPGNCDIYHLGSTEKDDKGFIHVSKTELVRVT